MLSIVVCWCTITLQQCRASPLPENTALKRRLCKKLNILNDRRNMYITKSRRQKRKDVKKTRCRQVIALANHWLYHLFFLSSHVTEPERHWPWKQWLFSLQWPPEYWHQALIFFYAFSIYPFTENDLCNSFHGGPIWIWKHWSECQASFLSWHIQGSWGAILRIPLEQKTE